MYQTEEKTVIPPIRIIVAGDDVQFFEFVQQYVKLLEIDQASSDLDKRELGLNNQDTSVTNQINSMIKKET